MCIGYFYTVYFIPYYRIYFKFINLWNKNYLLHFTCLQIKKTNIKYNICMHTYIYNIRTLSVNIKFICTSFRNRQNSEPLPSFSGLFRSEFHTCLRPPLYIATGYQESLFVGWKVYSSSTNKAKIYSYSIFVQQMYWLQDKMIYNIQ
jgi:hypothetical protein